MDIATLGLAVDSRQVKTAERDLDRLTNTGKRTERQTDQIGQAFRRLAAPLAAYLGARQIADSAEQWTTLNNRLRLVTDSTESFLAAQDDVFRIAQNSRQPLQATAELYQRIAINADELGLSGAGLAGVVDTINKTMAISGTSAAAAQAAMVQLGQGFASGTLRGEELNSVLEQAPALAQAIARGMGVAVGDLKALGESGALTAGMIIEALQSQAGAVDEQFSRIQKTAGQAFTTLGNSITRVVGEIDSATSASAGLADAIVDVSSYLDSGALTDTILYSMEVWRGTINSTIDNLRALEDELDLLSDIGGASADFIGQAFADMPANITAMIRVAVTEVAAMIDVHRNAIQTLIEARNALVTGDTVSAAFGRADARNQAMLQARRDSLQAIFDEREAVIGVAGAEQARRDQERKSRDQARADRQKDIAALREGAGVVDLASAAASDKAAKAAEKAAKAIEKQFISIESDLQRQIALYGETSEASRIRYETERGDLQRLSVLEKARLESLAEQLDRLNQFKAAQEEINDSIAKDFADTIKEIEASGDDLAKEFGANTDEMSVFAKRAAENIQDAFADFLFDPFKDGLDGLLDNFVKILQRMAAEQAAAGIMDWALGKQGKDGTRSGGFDWAGALSTFAGFFDAGGNIPAGGWGLAGEKGPEIIRGPATVISRKDTAGMMGGGNTYNISLPGIQTEKEARMAGGAVVRQLNRATSNPRYN